MRGCRCGDSYRVCLWCVWGEGVHFHTCVCVDVNIILGQRHSQRLVKLFSSATCAVSTVALHLCDWLQQRARSSLSVNGDHCKKVFVLQQSRGFIPSLWLSNEALCCLIPSGTQEISQKKVELFFHQGWWHSVHLHMSGLRVPLRASLGNHR